MSMFGIGKGFWGGLIGLFFFSIIVFFVIYLLVPDVSIRFFGISVNSDEYIDKTISQSISELDLPDGILTDIQSYLSSDEGKEYLDNIQSSVGNGADKAISYFSSENFKTLISNAGEAIASGAESASEFFSSHSVTSE